MFSFIWSSAITIVLLTTYGAVAASEKGNCPVLASLFEDILNSDPRTEACDVHIVGTLGRTDCGYGNGLPHNLHDSIRRPISVVEANASMVMGNVLFNRCAVSILGTERISEFLDLAGDYQRTFTDFFVILVESQDEMESLPKSLNKYSNIVIVMWDAAFSQGVYLFGQGLYTESQDILRPFAKWNREGFHQVKAPIFPTWRDSPFRAKGELLTILATNNDQAVILPGNGSFTGYIDGNDTSMLSGSDVSMMRFMASKRNFNLRFWINYDGYGGYSNESGRFQMWTPGYFYYMRYEEADLFVAFQYPYYGAYFCISFFPCPTYQFAWEDSFYTAFPKHQDNWYGFLDPFSKFTWIGLLITLLSFFCAIHFVFFGSDTFNDFGYMFVSLTALGNGDLWPRKASHYILLLTWILPATVLYFSYSTSLMSDLIVVLPGKPVDTWQQLYDRKYNLLIQDNFVSAFVRSAYYGIGAPILGQIWNSTSMVTKIPYEDVLDPTPLQKRVMDTPKTAVVFTADSFLIATDMDGNVVLHQSAVERLDPHYSAFLVRRNLSYFEPLYQDFQWLRDTGATEIFNMQGRIEKGWLHRMMKFEASKSRSASGSDDSSAKPLDIKKLQGSFYILLCGCFVALVWFIILEVIHGRCSKIKRDQN